LVLLEAQSPGLLPLGSEFISAWWATKAEQELYEEYAEQMR